MKNKGILYGIAAYTLWGLFPIYWKALQGIPAIEILSHRMVWSFFFMLLVLAVTKRWRWIRPVLKQPKVMLTFLATAVLLSINWFTYIWGVNNGFIVETALGYFINPLVNVLLGFIFSERTAAPRAAHCCVPGSGRCFVPDVYLWLIALDCVDAGIFVWLLRVAA